MTEEEFINDFYKGNDYRQFAILQETYRENNNLKQALNEIENYCNIQIKNNEHLIERLEGTSSFRIGNAKSMITEFKNILQIIEKASEEEQE